MLINPMQLRAARALIDIAQTDLVRMTGWSLNTIVDFEKQRRAVSEAAVTDIRQALERAGVEFLPKSDDAGVGVRLKNGD